MFKAFQGSYYIRINMTASQAHYWMFKIYEIFKSNNNYIC